MEPNKIGQSAASARIYIECTSSSRNAGGAGISRVVNGIIRNCESVGAKMGVECVPVVILNDRFYRLGDMLRQDGNSDGKSSKAKSTSGALSKARKMVGPGLKSALLASQAGRRVVHGTVRSLGRLRDTLSLANAQVSPVDFTRDDLLIMTDMNWEINPWPAIRGAKKSGASVGVVIYDLIVIQHPDTLEADIVEFFSDWLTRSLKVGDFFLAISRATRDYLLDYQSRNLPAAKRVRAESFMLGADLDEKCADRADELQFSDAFSRDEKTFLIVSTIEPRKNHGFLLDAFERVWSRGGAGRLVIVGREGWKCGPIARRIRSHEMFGKKLFMFNNASDADVDYCYRNSRALVFSSIAEGFGLPIVESLRRGLKVFASDIPIHREVGGDYCTYFGLDDPENLAELITADCSGENAAATKPQTRPAKKFNWITWRQSCKQFIEIAIRLKNENDRQD